LYLRACSCDGYYNIKNANLSLALACSRWISTPRLVLGAPDTAGGTSTASIALARADYRRAIWDSIKNPRMEDCLPSAIVVFLLAPSEELVGSVAWTHLKI
jgi:hypothetical protein